MANTYFNFKRFSVNQDRCAMKVGTDGVLLGATADGGARILDIGTGTGLVALMMAQRFPDAVVTGVDIDKDAAIQAQENVQASPFADRVTILEADIASFAPCSTFDCIVCNPPFYENALSCPDERRSTARHTSALPFEVLMRKVADLLSDDGLCTIIVPTDCLPRIEEECAYCNLFVVKKLFIKTTARKSPKRVIVTIGRHPSDIASSTQCLTEDGKKSTWYQDVCKDFYL